MPWCVAKRLIERMMMIYRDMRYRYTVQQTSSEAFSISALLQQKHFISCLLHANVCLPLVE